MNPFLPLAKKMLEFSPDFAIEARRYLEVDPEIFLAKELTKAVVASAVVIVLFAVLGFLIPGVFLALAFLLFSLYSAFARPKIEKLRRKALMEAKFSEAIQHILILVESGIPISNALAIVASQDYGEISESMKRIMQRVATGQALADALEEESKEVPLIYLKRVYWVLANSIRTGTDPSPALSAILSDFQREKKIELEKYARELNPWALMFLVIAVVFPAMMVSMIVVTSSLLPVQAIRGIILGVVFLSAAFQFFFYKTIKLRRPASI